MAKLEMERLERQEKLALEKKRFDLQMMEFKARLAGDSSNPTGS